MSKKRDYVLINFINELKEDDAPESIDVVPKIWLSYDKKIDKCVTPFPSPPYSYKKMKDLHHKVTHLLEADKQWPKFPVIIVGHASKYME